MIVIVDDRSTVVNGYTSWFDREGISAVGVNPADFEQWISTTRQEDLTAVEAILLGPSTNRRRLLEVAKNRGCAVVIVLNEARSLEETLALFDAGADDVVQKPVHVRELLARIKAIRRRQRAVGEGESCRGIRVYCDGREPDVAGKSLPLPRRERRILEFLMLNKGRRVTKAQIFNYVYGLQAQETDENVIESHISKLRKRIRQRLGYDPIDSQRYLGYRLLDDTVSDASSGDAIANLTQVTGAIRKPEIAVAQGQR